MENKFKPDSEHHYSDIDEGNFMFPKLGKCMIKDELEWKNSNRDDIIEYNESLHSTELNQNFIIGDSVPNEIRDKIISKIKKYWDSFCSEGARRPILGYEFAINTGSHTPVCE